MKPFYTFKNGNLVSMGDSSPEVYSFRPLNSLLTVSRINDGKEIMSVSQVGKEGDGGQSFLNDGDYPDLKDVHSLKEL